MDILHLIDRLEELFNESKAVPLANRILVDEDKLLDLIDQMRLSVPEEIRKAQSIINQQDRIVAQATEEANRIVALARQQREKLIAKDLIVEKAKLAAENIKNQAIQENEVIKREADQYAIDSLDHLEVELSKILYQVRNGITALKNNQIHSENLTADPEFEKKEPDHNQ